MIHVAILKKSFGFLQKIASGEKTIESRWYVSRRAPWACIKRGEMVYFKDAGEPIVLCARVADVLEVADLTVSKARMLLARHGKAIGFVDDVIEHPERWLANKRYAILIFLERPRGCKPFRIEKRGFGTMSAWITAPKLDVLRKD